ncbi:FAD/NAD(P)-binding oxidoreductase [Burkholderia sp. WAC0059]|uniref:FAD-dependent oxidoreductase n=1 Tax=Burkholderia sp. WAC0059 TaxID=2066022 RepID=UPI000C7EC324|nr:FAD-dependent oxidoreductase [Burkholderia sp. WAC0059]PLZ02416.1 FAD/NAD(P)-binding oxidoreductase [Burkholderia sp. WAC0059]
MSVHYDVVVVGAGPAGLSAARAAAGRNARVAVLDDNPLAGGQVWRQGPGRAPQPPLRDLLDALRAQPRVAFWASARVVGPLGPERGLLVESPAYDGAVAVTFDRLILATGARERLLPFGGWTLPGVTGAGGLQALIKGGLPVRGERIVIAGSGPLLLAALATAREAGAHVLAVVEQASAAALARFGISLAAAPSKLWQAAQLTRGFAGLRYWPGSTVRAARGDGRVEQVSILRGTREVVLECDRVACGYGLVPHVALARMLGCRIDGDGGVAVDDAQRTSVDGVLAAGECAGIGGVELARVEGDIAGRTATDMAGATVDAGLRAERARWRRFAERAARAFALGPAARAVPPPDTLLCRCEDVSLGEVGSQPSWRDAKLHTRCGMGACQGRICGEAAKLYFGWDAPAPRLPLNPARIGTLMSAADAPADAD